jgi:hypothetical protein
MAHLLKKAHVNGDFAENGLLRKAMHPLFSAALRTAGLSFPVM